MSAGIKITVITVTYNASSFIEATLDSVINQTYTNLEYIVVDGLSTDDTLYKINAYKSRICKIITEKDGGIYDAMNKGVASATGDYVIFMNAGDIFSERDTLLRLSTCIDPFASKIYIGKTVHLYPNKEIVTPPVRVDTNFSFGMGGCCHQSMLIPLAVQKCFPYDLSFRLAADYNFLLTSIKNKVEVETIELIVAKIAIGGVSFRFRRKVYDEYFIALRGHTTSKFRLFQIVILHKVHVFMLVMKNHIKHVVGEKKTVSMQEFLASWKSKL